MNQNLIVSIGEILWDIFPEGKRLGGAPANFAFHTNRLGLNSLVVSAIGSDVLADEIVAILKEKGVNSHIERTSFPTGTVRVELNEKGIPTYEITENVAWDNIPFTPGLEAIARATKAVCFGSLAQRSEISRATIRRFIDAIPASNDPLIVFDINLRLNFYSPQTLIDSLRRCNVLKINDEELDILSRLFELSDSEPVERCRMILEKYNLRILILTCGADGSYILTPDAVSYMPAPKIEVADTVGAGDSFTAAFIASIVKGDSIQAAHRKAAEVSAFVCSQNGATPELPKEMI